jgi:hypothetical protein
MLEKKSFGAISTALATSKKLPGKWPGSKSGGVSKTGKFSPCFYLLSDVDSFIDKNKHLKYPYMFKK